ncbi:efflux RND transporter permease subunit [Herbaspirillum lusitanum]|uniref:efflux RND transporter permease subunit n=1 Tax=Herbaspirillum lusitanum TaxID=213312 RepID=UPI000303D0B0|nr:MMPL family transporter [Herbaspirillum lusitanum]
MMTPAKKNEDGQPIVRDLKDFDRQSGTRVERLLFNHRAIVLLICLLVTLVLGTQIPNLSLNANFEKMIPTSHPYVVNFLKYKSDLAGLGNAVRIAVATKKGTIYSPEYLETLQKINDEVFLLPGVERTNMRSLWTPSTQWVGVTEDGMEGGPVIPNNYNGSPQSLTQVQLNIERSGEIGQLVALDAKSSIIYVPLLDNDSATGKPLDYAEFSGRLEELRAKYETSDITLHITGFAQVVGNLISGLQQMLFFFVFAILVTALMLYWYTRCLRSTLLVVVSSMVAVVWQLGILPLAGFQLDPYSILVPFLVFAIGMSHGAQKMNGILQDIGRGTHRVVAARYTFRRLFLAGLTALLCDAVGFAVLKVIEIKVIQDLAAIASIGVAVLVFTNLIMLPIFLSYVGVGQKAARRSIAGELEYSSPAEKHPAWRFFDLFTRRKWASITVVAATLMAVGGFIVSLDLQVGDLDPGAPELRAESRYNKDNAFINRYYAAGSDVYAVMVKTPDAECASYDTLMKVDALEWKLRQLNGVDSTVSLAGLNRRVLVGLNEGNPKWFDLVKSQATLNMVTSGAPRGLYNGSCNLLTVYAFLRDHKAETLTRVNDAVNEFSAANNSERAQFLLAAGPAGIEAATNIVVKKASHEMLLWVYGAVIILCLLTFRSWRAVVCAVLPLVLTSILCEALMVKLNMGVKVATLPVIALGVGIGIDYALYVMSITLTKMREGKSLSEAYYDALTFTGKVVMLTGVTLAAGVATWAFSPIKFQADMGILLAFMFLWNMLGALILLPALAYFLLPPTAFKNGKLDTVKSLSGSEITSDSTTEKKVTA